jgi:hypothetical protein
LAAAIVAISLVSAPNPADPQIPRPVNVPTIQLLAIATEINSATTHTNSAITTPSRTAAVTPHASASGLTPQNLLMAGVAIALTPFWYAAFPITLPLSFIAVSIFSGVLAGIFGTPPIGTGNAIRLALQVFATAPLIAIKTSFSALAAQSVSVAANASSPPRADRSTTSGAPRQGHRAQRDPADSPRAADHTPTTHRTAKSTPTTAKETKRSGTAGSGRGVGNQA